jgi:hypothetical protein
MTLFVNYTKHLKTRIGIPWSIAVCVFFWLFLLFVLKQGLALLPKLALNSWPQERLLGMLLNTWPACFLNKVLLEPELRSR